MIELKELRLEQNQIKSIEAMHNYPNLVELWLSNNPISMIFPEAFAQVKSLNTLVIDDVKFRWPREDLIFLKKVSNTLTRLSLNRAFPKENLESIEELPQLYMPELDELSLRQVGLL